MREAPIAGGAQEASMAWPVAMPHRCHKAAVAAGIALMSALVIPGAHEYQPLTLPRFTGGASFARAPRKPVHARRDRTLPASTPEGERAIRRQPGRAGR
jgi:hypothetical protein